MESYFYNGSITISDVIQFLYCPRFTYFMHCLAIPQREERNYKVRKGRELHASKEKTNLSYLRKRYGVTKKSVEVYMNSIRLGIRGVVDEVLFLENGTAAPLDYKFAEYRKTLFRTHRIQSTLYGLLICDTYDIPVNRGYIVYTRSKDKIIEIGFTDIEKEKAVEIIEEVYQVIQEEHYPEVKINKRKCLDCTYRRICTQ